MPSTLASIFLYNYCCSQKRNWIQDATTVESTVKSITPENVFAIQVFLLVPVFDTLSVTYFCNTVNQAVEILARDGSNSLGKTSIVAVQERCAWC